MRHAFMNSAMLVVPLLAAPCLASEVGILADKQFGQAQILASERYDAVSPTGYGIRGALELVDLKVFELSLSAAYHGKAEQDLVSGGKRLGSFSHEYAAVGLQFDWRLLVNLNVGAEMRRERLATVVGTLGDSTIYSRPWIRAGIGVSLPTPFVKPFVRLEVAYAAARETTPADWDGLRKALAPRYSVGLYAGIHF